MLVNESGSVLLVYYIFVVINIGYCDNWYDELRNIVILISFIIKNKIYCRFHCWNTLE